MAREPQLKELPGGNIKLHAEHFRRVVRRIECTKPLAGDGITLEEKDNGIKISVDPATLAAASGGAMGLGDLAKLIELDVCKNGEPSTIYVLGFNTEGEAELAADRAAGLA